MYWTSDGLPRQSQPSAYWLEMRRRVHDVAASACDRGLRRCPYRAWGDCGLRAVYDDLARFNACLLDSFAACRRRSRDEVMRPCAGGLCRRVSGARAPVSSSCHLAASACVSSLGWPGCVGSWVRCFEEVPRG